MVVWAVGFVWIVFAGCAMVLGWDLLVGFCIVVGWSCGRVCRVPVMAICVA